MLQMTASSPRPKHHAITNTEDLHQDDPKLHSVAEPEQLGTGLLGRLLL